MIELFVNDSFNWASFMNLFSIRVELFFYLTQRIEPSFNMTQKIFEYFLKDLNSFLNTTQRIDPFFNTTQKLKFLVDKNWTLSNELWLKETFVIELFSPKMMQSFFFQKKKRWFEEWNLLENMTHRIEFFKQKKKSDSKNWTFLTLTQRTVFLRLKNELFFKYGSKNWIFCLVSVKELVFSSMTHWKLLKELFFHVSKSWFFFNMSQRIQLFFQIRRKELHPFLNTTQRIEPFFLWILEWIRRKELNPFFLWTWRKELKALFKKN